MTTKRLTRHEIKEPDQFMTAMDHAVQYVQRRRRPVIAGAALLLAALVAVVVLVAGARSRAARANAALGALVELAGRPVAGEPEAEAEGRKRETFPDAAARDNAVLAEADALLARFGSHPAADGARMIKAQALARRGRFADAARAYAEVAGDRPGSPLEVAAAFAGAEARDAAGETDAAVEQLKRLAALEADDPYLPRGAALERAARLLERKGDLVSASQLYQRVLDEAPETPAASAARPRLEELRRKLAESPPPAPAGAAAIPPAAAAASPPTGP